MKLFIPGLACLMIMMLIAGCSANPGRASDADGSVPPETVTANVIFRVFSAADQQPLSDVRLVIIDQNGRIAGTPVTDDAGEVRQELTVPADPKYPMARGTVAVIAYKPGYRDLVLLETPVSEGSAAQPLYLEPDAPDGRNEPTVQAGNNHRLDIMSMVDKYKSEAQGPSSACGEPPRSIEWNGKTYNLKAIGGEELEPGMKLGYLECADGVLTQHGEGENATYNIYSFGSPPDRDELLYFGAWGRALYTPADPEAP